MEVRNEDVALKAPLRGTESYQMFSFAFDQNSAVLALTTARDSDFLNIICLPMTFHSSFRHPLQAQNGQSDNLGLRVCLGVKSRTYVYVCMNGTSPRQTAVHIVMSLGNKYT